MSELAEELSKGKDCGLQLQDGLGSTHLRCSRYLGTFAEQEGCIRIISASKTIQGMRCGTGQRWWCWWWCASSKRNSMWFSYALFCTGTSPALALLALALTMIWTNTVPATHETPWPRVPMHQNSLGSVYNTLVRRLHPQTVTWHGTLALGISRWGFNFGHSYEVVWLKFSLLIWSPPQMISSPPCDVSARLF